MAKRGRPKKTPKPKAAALPIRSIIATLDDRVKAALVNVLVHLAKTDIRAAELYARYSGEGGMMTSPTPLPCHFTLNLGAATAREEDYIDEQYTPDPYEEESDDERRSRW